MDRLDELAIFVRIVEEGSLARAASRLRRSPPAVTRALASLEDRIGLRLIDRTTRRLAPSEAGRALYDRARALVADYEPPTAGAPSSKPEWRVAGAARGATPRLNGRLRADDVETRLRAAREGRGIAQLLSYQVADELAAGRLVRLLQAFERPPLPVHLVTKGRAHRAPKIDAFLDFAASRLVALPVLSEANDARA